MLDVSDLRVSFGSVPAVDGVSMHVGTGEIVALVGHNGAGKTTLLRAIAGLQAIQAGRVEFDGAPVEREKAHLVARKVAFVRQGRNVFSELTVGDNLGVARDASLHGSMSEAEIFSLFPALANRKLDRAGSLSGGQQQMLALSLALTRRPALIMLDEPSTGLAPLLVQSLFAVLARLNAELGTAFLIIDQNIEQLMTLASRAYVLKAGNLVYDGSAEELRSANLWSYF